MCWAHVFAARKCRGERRPPRFPTFASRNFRIFWTTQFISLIGTWMQTTVQAYLAYHISGQPIYLGVIGAASTLPTLLLTLPAGVWVERRNKRTVVIVLQGVMLAQAFTLAFLTIMGWVTIAWLIALSLVLGAANAIEVVARNALLPELVDKPTLANAIALQATAFNIARVLGPLLAAPLVALFAYSEGWAFFANGISYGIVIIGLFAIHPSTTQPARANNATSALTQFREGQRYIRQTSLIALIIFLGALPTVLAFPVTQQIPAFARDVLAQPNDTDATVAARNSVMFTLQGLGGLIAAVLQVALSHYPRKGLLMLIGGFVFSLALLGMAFSHSLALTLIALVLLGWGTTLTLISSNIIIQHVVPPDMRSRVFSSYLWARQGIAPLGSLLVGTLAQQFGAPMAALVCGIACLVIVGVVNIITPTVRLFIAT